MSRTAVPSRTLDVDSVVSLHAFRPQNDRQSWSRGTIV
jgi:hypothetical protein